LVEKEIRGDFSERFVNLIVSSLSSMRAYSAKLNHDIKSDQNQ
jgi:hypothetical protein